MFDFGGRRVLVTGASSGLGRAIAVGLSQCGASVILMGRNTGRLAQTAGMLHTPAVDILKLDLRDPGQIGAAVAPVVARHGRLFGLCHCAGTVETRPLSATRSEHIREMMEINVISGLELAKVVSRRDVMTEDEGSILFVSSIYAHVGMAGQIGYSATKGALLTAARAMAVELARRKIRVNTVSPGLVHTPLSDGALSALTPEQKSELEAAHPLGPGTPEDVARAAVFLLAPQNRWITGTDLVIDGGFTAR